MDYAKYVVLWLWLGPIFFLAASIRRILLSKDPISYILDIVAAIAFFIGLLGTLIGQALGKGKGKEKLHIVYWILNIIYLMGPVFYFFSSVARLRKWTPSLIADIIDVLCTICFFTASLMSFILEIKHPRSNLHIIVIFIYWLGPCVLISAAISYIINEKSLIPNYLEILSASIFTLAATIWLMTEILVRNNIVNIPLEEAKENNIVNITLKEREENNIVNIPPEEAKENNIVNIPPEEAKENNIVNIPLKECEENNIVNIPLKEREENNIVNIPLEEAKENNSVNIPLKECEENNIVNIPLEDTKENNSVNIPPEESEENNIVNIPLEDTKENNIVNIPLKEREENNIVNIPPEDVKENNNPS